VPADRAPAPPGQELLASPCPALRALLDTLPPAIASEQAAAARGDPDWAEPAGARAQPPVPPPAPYESPARRASLVSPGAAAAAAAHAAAAPAAAPDSPQPHLPGSPAPAQPAFSPAASVPPQPSSPFASAAPAPAPAPASDGAWLDAQVAGAMQRITLETHLELIRSCIAAVHEATAEDAGAALAAAGALPFAARAPPSTVADAVRAAAARGLAPPTHPSY